MTSPARRDIRRLAAAAAASNTGSGAVSAVITDPGSLVPADFLVTKTAGGFDEVYGDYTSVVEEVMSREHVPPGYRFYVKRYFQLIKPRE